MTDRINVALQRALAMSGEAPAGEGAGSVLVAIGLLGERLHELGGPDLMYDAYSEVVRAAPERAELLNDMWEGIGEWVRPQ